MFLAFFFFFTFKWHFSGGSGRNWDFVQFSPWVYSVFRLSTRCNSPFLRVYLGRPDNHAPSVEVYYYQIILLLYNSKPQGKNSFNTSQSMLCVMFMEEGQYLGGLIALKQPDRYYLDTDRIGRIISESFRDPVKFYPMAIITTVTGCAFQTSIQN